MARKLPTVMSIDEFTLLLKNTGKPHHRIAFKLGFLCGLRVSEIVKLKPEDVDQGRKMLFIRQGKGNKDRYVPYPKQLTRELNKLPIGCGVRALEIAFKRAWAKTGVHKNLHFHHLRHSCATYYLDKGMPITHVQQLLGHSRIDTTMIYTHVSPENVASKMEEIWR